MRIKYFVGAALICVLGAWAYYALRAPAEGHDSSPETISARGRTDAGAGDGVTNVVRRGRKSVADRIAELEGRSADRAAKLADKDLDKLDKAELDKIMKDIVKLSEPMIRMRRMLDSGDRKGALHAAREMRFSESRIERRAALAVLGWIGDSALPELTSMLSDPDPEIAEEALDQWRQAMDEMETDDLRCELIIEAAKTFTDEDLLFSMMLEMTKMDDAVVQKALTDILEGDSTSVAKNVANEIYDYIFESNQVSPEEENRTWKRKRARLAAEEAKAAALQAQEGLANE